MNRVLAAACAAALLIVAAPRGAAAAGSPAGVASVTVRATTQKGTFRGNFVVGSYAADGTDLVARGRLVGTLRDKRYPSARDIEQNFTTVVGVTGAPAGGTDCAQLTLGFAGKTLRLFGLSATLAPRVAAVRPRGENAAGIEQFLCVTNQLLALTPAQPTPQPPADWLLRMLNGLRAVDR